MAQQNPKDVGQSYVGCEGNREESLRSRPSLSLLCPRRGSNTQPVLTGGDLEMGGGWVGGCLVVTVEGALVALRGQGPGVVDLLPCTVHLHICTKIPERPTTEKGAPHLSAVSSILPFPRPGTTKYFQLLNVPLLEISYTWHFTICGPSCLPSFTQHVSKVHPCCCLLQCLGPL